MSSVRVSAARHPAPPPDTRHPIRPNEAERERYVTWWLYESGPSVDDLIEIATMLVEAETWGRVAA